MHWVRGLRIGLWTIMSESVLFEMKHETHLDDNECKYNCQELSSRCEAIPTEHFSF